MIRLIITAYKEPKIRLAIEAALSQKTKYEYKVIVCAPDKETLDIAESYHMVDIVQDPGKGKSNAINLLLQEFNYDEDILVLTDGDVYISDNAIEEIGKMFEDKTIGCVAARPVPQEDKSTKYGYWANFLFDAAHNLRQKAYDNKSFIECSGYLFAFRRILIDKIPMDVAEDSVIPYKVIEQRYRIGYAAEAKTYVKNVDNWDDWLKQKKRTALAHSKLDRYVDTQSTKKVKSFKTEAKGIGLLFTYPKSIKQFWWTIQLCCARAYMWTQAAKDKDKYQDGWETVASTK